jgi:hypothetical protein
MRHANCSALLEFVAATPVFLLIILHSVAQAGDVGPQAIGSSPCAEKVQDQVALDQRLRLILLNEDVIEGCLVRLTPTTLELKEGCRDPGMRARSVPLDSLQSVAYWTRDYFQPSWILAGTFSGLVIGGLVGRLSGEEDKTGEDFLDSPGLRGALLGSTIGLIAGAVLSQVVLKATVVPCHDESSER